MRNRGTWICDRLGDRRRQRYQLGRVIIQFGKRASGFGHGTNYKPTIELRDGIFPLKKGQDWSRYSINIPELIGNAGAYTDECQKNKPLTKTYRVGEKSSLNMAGTKNMRLCLFGDHPLNTKTKPEHILLDALGGRMTTRLAICSDCNNRFGGSIDDILASQVLAFRNLMQLKSGSGDPAPMLKNIQAGHQRVNIMGNGEIQPIQKPFTVEELEDGRWNVQINARSEEEIVRFIPNIAAKLRISEEILRAQISAASATKISKRPDTVQHQLRVGGPDAIRSMIKSGLILWSTLVGNTEVRGLPYEAARNFVANGNDQFVRDFSRLDSRPFTELDEITKAYGKLFNLIYVRSDAEGRVIGHFTLYNIWAWQFTLAEAGGKPNAKIALISDPLNPSRWSKKAADEFDIPFEWLKNPDFSDEFVRSKERIDAALRLHFEIENPKAVRLIVDECLRDLKISAENPIPPERMREISNKVAERFALHFLNLPYKENITPEQIAEILRKYPPATGPKKKKKRH